MKEEIANIETQYEVSKNPEMVGIPHRVVPNNRGSQLDENSKKYDFVVFPQVKFAKKIQLKLFLINFLLCKVLERK